MHPEATEVAYTGIDEDCDPATSDDDCEFGPHGSCFAYATADESILYFDLRTGEILDTIVVPNAAEEGARSEPRDLAQTDDGRIAVFNGTFEPYLSVYDPATTEWTHVTAPDWALTNMVYAGGLATYDHFVFVVNHSIITAEAAVIRFDLDGGEPTWFAVGRTDIQDVSVGLDGLLYVQDDLGEVQIYDLETLEFQRELSIDLATGEAGVVADADGNIYGVSWSNFAVKVAPDGTELARLDFDGVVNTFDLDLRANGSILIGERKGTILQTDTSFATPRPLSIASTSVFVAYAR